METLVSIVTAFIVGTVVLAGATVTGKKDDLCQAMGGTYKPTAPDQCPDGKWSNLIQKAVPLKK